MERDARRRATASRRGCSPVPAGGEVVVVGAALDDQREALATLLALGASGCSRRCCSASAAGYWVAGIALRPVEAMRRAAEAITDTPGQAAAGAAVDDEIGRLGVTLNAMLERLERARGAERQAVAKERRFIADASHELRTPLTILKTRGRRRAAASGAAPRSCAPRSRSSGEEADRLVRLAEDLLVLARADEGGLPIAPEPVDVRELLDGIAAAQRPSGGGAAGGRRCAGRPRPCVPTRSGSARPSATCSTTPSATAADWSSCAGRGVTARC